MYSRTCIVEFSINHHTDKTGTCSGVIIGNNQNVYVLTTALALNPLVNEPEASLILNALQNSKSLQFTEQYNFFQSLCILENINENPKTISSNKKTIFTALLNCIPKSHTAEHNEVRYFNARPIYVWQCQKLAHSIEKLMPKHDGWKLETGMSSNEDYDNHYKVLLSSFILLKLENWSSDNKLINRPFSDSYFLKDDFKCEAKLWSEMFITSTKGETNIQPVNNKPHKVALEDGLNPSYDEDLVDFLKRNVISHRLTKGDCVYLVGTPFGSLSPPVFMNSISKGIVSHTAGTDDVLIMTDARCIPGCEGGALYVKTNKSKWHLKALVLLGLCWKNKELLGLTLACDLNEILFSLTKYLHRETLTSPLSLSKNNIRGLKTSEKLASIIERVVHIKVGSEWGSGIVVNCDPPIIVTCAHVVRNAERNNINVKFVYHKRTHHLLAKLIYSVPPNQPFDVAILQVDALPAGFCRKKHLQIERNPTQGNDVYAIGHALFDFDLKPSPFITSGIVSKVLRHHNIPFMIQSSCMVCSGISGGALVDNETETLIGLIACNTKDYGDDITYPDLNISIPMSAIWPHISKYIKSKDPQDLSGLQIKSIHIQKFWKFQINGFLPSNL